MLDIRLELSDALAKISFWPYIRTSCLRLLIGQGRSFRAEPQNHDAGSRYRTTWILNLGLARVSYSSVRLDVYYSDIKLI